MRFRDGVATGEVLDVCRPFLSGALPPALRTSLPPFIGSLEPPELSGPDSLTMVNARTPARLRNSLQAALVLAEPEGRGSSYGRPNAGGLSEEPPSGAPGMPESGEDADPPAASSEPAYLPGSPPVLEVTSLHGALAALLNAFADRFQRAEPFASGDGNLVSPSAVVDGCLEGGVIVGAGAVIGSGSYIGAGTRIGPNVVIHEHCRIGRGCVIQAGAVIGATGFGFFPDPAGKLEPLPHPAGVEIGDDCWIGAQTVIAAGVLAPTSLGRGSKVDSLVQIAHNVRIGDAALIASQCGIAGSTVIGSRFRMGGSAGLGDHLRIGDDVSVAAFSGVTKNLPDGSTVAGFPARPIAEWRRQEIGLKGLGRPSGKD